MALDSATNDFLERVSASATKPRHLMTPDEARSAFVRLRGLLQKGSDIEKVKDISIPVPDGAGLRCRIFIPAESSAVMIYFHGGGWVVGGIEEFDPMCRDIAAKSGVSIALVEYRKAPEHIFPGPIEDAWNAFNYLSKNAADLIGKTCPLLVGGDSAGGHLAIAVTLRSRDESGPEIKGQLLVYPVTDSSFKRHSYLAPENQLMLNLETMQYYWKHFLPDEVKRKTALVSPCSHAELKNLPPAILITAEHDVLRDEGEEYAKRLIDAGVGVNFRRFESQMHGFLMMRGILPGSDTGIEYVAHQLQCLSNQLV